MLNSAIQSGDSSGAANTRYQPTANEGQTHTVVHGDTLSEIAEKNGVSLSALIAANPQIKNPDLIYPGDKVSIPAGDGEQAADAGENASTARSEVSMNDQARAAQVRGSNGGNNILSNISTTGASAKRWRIRMQHAFSNTKMRLTQPVLNMVCHLPCWPRLPAANHAVARRLTGMDVATAVTVMA
jgi:spore coat assembly protein SafA